MKRITSVVVGLLLAFVGTSESFAETITVCPTGCDYTNIQAAVDASAAGDVIQVLPGTYTFAGDSQDLVDQVIILPDHHLHIVGSNDPTRTIIDGENVRGGLLGVISDDTNTTVIEGLTFQNCSAHTKYAYPYGGGLFCFDRSIEIRNCIFKHNSALVGGGAFIANDCDDELYDCADGLQRPLIIHCTFIGNEATDSTGGKLTGGLGGGLCTSGGRPQIKHCHFRNNTASKWGGGICQFANSFYGGGIEISHCTISGNSAQLGGGLYLDTEFSTLGNNGTGGYLTNLEHCTISENIAIESGGGIYTSSACIEPEGGNGCVYPISTFAECTISNNTANQIGQPDAHGGGIYIEGHKSPLLDDCTISGNFPDGIYRATDDDSGSIQIEPVTLQDTVICGNGDEMTLGQVSGTFTHVGATYIHPNCSDTNEIGDLNGDGCVNGADLGILLAAWSICP